MSDKRFVLEVVTPNKMVFIGEVESFSAPGVMGGFQVLRSHAPLLAAVDIGEVKLRAVDGAEHRFATSGGFVEVLENKVMLLAETAERDKEIDVDRAQRARDRARDRIRQRAKETDLERAREAFRRAQNRLRIARSS